jgi:division protein CdvB (Snf7/Vps24/ESCRT-III family)
MTEMRSTMAMQDSMKKVTRAMVAMNKKADLPQMQKILREFQRQSEKLEMNQEVMGDVLDDSLDDEDEEEQQAIVNQVLDEIGIHLADQLVQPNRRVAQQAEAEPEVEVHDHMLEERLANLKK